MSAAEQSDGWIEWAGGECPVGGDTVVDYIMRCETLEGYRSEPVAAQRLDWSHSGDSWNIIAYRLVKP